MKAHPNLLIFCIGFLAFFQPTGLMAQESLTIAVPKTLSSIPFLELQNKIVGDRKVVIEIFEDHALAFAQFLSKKYDLILTGFSQGAANSRSNPELIHLLTPVWGVSSLITLDKTLSGLTDFKALEGKILTVPFAGSPLDQQLRALLRSQSLEGLVRIQYSPIPQQIPLLLSGQVQAISLPEPLASRLILQNGAYEVFSFSQAWGAIAQGDPRSPQVSLFALRNHKDSWGSVMPALLNALKATTKRVKELPEEVAPQYTEFFGLPTPLLIRGLTKTLLEITPFEAEKKAILTYQRLVGDTKPLGQGFFLETRP